MTPSGAAKKTAEREMARLAEISVTRLEEVVASLNARLVTVTQDVAQRQRVLEHAQDVASFAQEILAIVSHDLRNPLNSILLSAQVILALHPTNEALHRPVNRIVGSAMAAMRLINDLLDFSQARLAGGIPIVRRDSNIHTLAQTAVEELEFAKRGHSMQVRSEGDGLSRFDPDRLSQVLMNLISNALTHSPDDSAVDIATAGSNGTVVIQVHNTNREGPIPPEVMPVLFQPFKYGAVRSDSRSRSVGLGLYIVDQIVKAHGGRVDVSSTAEEGTTFTVSLPESGGLSGRE